MTEDMFRYVPVDYDLAAQLVEDGRLSRAELEDCLSAQRVRGGPGKARLLAILEERGVLGRGRADGVVAPEAPPMPLTPGAGDGEGQGQGQGQGQGTGQDQESGTATLPDTIGPWTIRREIERGPRSVVFEAYDAATGRRAAIKLLPDSALQDPWVLVRFHREAEVLAGLKHPGVVELYEAGEHPLGPYLALEYLEGHTLARLRDSGPLEPRLAATLARDCARAVEALHARGLVHRDLKPQNVLLAGPDAGGEVRVKLADFGLVRDDFAGRGPTATGEVLGTPHYMAPEQARGDREAVGPRTDVWGLGALLFHLLAGRPPYSGRNLRDVLLRIQSEEPELDALRAAGPGTGPCPPALERAVARCLRKDPSQRYPSAAAFAEDLERFLAGVERDAP